MAAFTLYNFNDNICLQVNTIQQAIDMMSITDNAQTIPADAGFIVAEKNRVRLSIFPVRRGMTSEFSDDELETRFPYYRNVGSKLMWVVVDLKVQCQAIIQDINNDNNDDQVVPNQQSHLIGLVDTVHLLREIY